MGQQNTERISHDIDSLPNTFRDDQLNQIINDLDEESIGKGYSQTFRTGPFLNKITVWETSSMSKKRTETTFSRTGAFVDSIVKAYFSEDGTSVIATLTATITRNASKQVSYVDVGIVRT